MYKTGWFTASPRGTAWARGRSTIFPGTVSIVRGSIPGSFASSRRRASSSTTARPMPIISAAFSPTIRCSRKPRGAGARRRSSTAARWRAGHRSPTRNSISMLRSPGSRPVSGSISTAPARAAGRAPARWWRAASSRSAPARYYTALREAAAEPVLQEICRHIAADELRHYRLFYKNLDRVLAKRADRPAGAAARRARTGRRIGRRRIGLRLLRRQCGRDSL